VPFGSTVLPPVPGHVAQPVGRVRVPDPGVVAEDAVHHRERRLRAGQVVPRQAGLAGPALGLRDQPLVAQLAGQ
jgi:hypothetical protein